MNSPFIGRQKELKKLQVLVDKKRAGLVVIKGRRRIGKSRLIEEFAKDSKFINISGIPPGKKVTAQHQRDEFARQMARIFAMPLPNSADWSDLFWYLAHQVQKGKVIILLDEISWMGSKDPTFLGKLKNAWDLYFKKNTQLILILCGSVSSWIEKNIISNSGFVGRIDLKLTLKELALQECNEFWGKRKQQISAYEKFKVLAITGGVPRYLEAISYHLSAEENIKQLCFTPEGFLFNEFNQIFHDLFAKRSENYKEILLCLISQPYAELAQVFKSLNMQKSGVISNYLEDLILAGFVQRDYTWSMATGRLSKLSHFRISDNYIRFYLKYILPNQAKIERDAYANRSLGTLPNWDSIMGLQFENLVLQNRHLLYQQLHIQPDEIVNDNPYFQRGTTKQKGCQIDYMIQTRFNTVYVCEIKFSKNPIGDEVVTSVQEKIKNLGLPRNFSYRAVLIHVNGVDDGVIAKEFFAQIIDFGSLLL